MGECSEILVGKEIVRKVVGVAVDRKGPARLVELDGQPQLINWIR